MKPHLQTLLALLMLACTVRAEALFVPIIDGKVMPIAPQPPPDGVRRIEPPNTSLPFRITASKVDVKIDDTVATTSMEQSFFNLTGRDLEVRVLIPLPAGATINSSSLSMNDQMVEGKLYDASQAQSIYESIVSQRRDPALLRFAGENLYEARIFPIPPNQERRLRFSYTQVLSPAGGLYDYRHILSGSQLYQGGIEKFAFVCTLRSKSRLGPVYSPSHQVAVQRPDSNTARIELSGINMSSDRDFRLLYSPTTEDVSMRLIAHRASDSEDGYFMLIGRVDEQLEKARILPKEIAFVVDTSGSMQGEKIEQTRNALKFCINSLNESDRFNLITFSTDVSGLSSSALLDANKENIKKALAAVDQIEASGGTNIDGALRATLGSDFSAGNAKAKMIVFMTDGLPTVGMTDPSSILQGVQAGNQKHKVRIFNFGVGNDVNTRLLDKISFDHDGASAYVSPREDIEVKVSDFMGKIKHPVMTEANFDFGEQTRAHSVYPKRIPALYRGGEITIVGRFKGSGTGNVTLSGNVAGDARKISEKVEWPSRDIGNSYLPRVWASRKIGHLLEDLRLHGQNPELIKEVVDLAQRHGIVTPYTSQLVLEPGMEGRRDFPGPPIAGRPILSPPSPMRTPEAALKSQTASRSRTEQAAREVSEVVSKSDKGSASTALSSVEKRLKDEGEQNQISAPSSGRDAVTAGGGGQKAEKEKEEMVRKLGEALASDAKSSGEMRRSMRGSGGVPAAESADLGKALKQAETETIKQVGARTFYMREGIWVDSTAKPDAKPKTIKSYSPEYFSLLKEDATLGSVFALGGRILVVVKDTLYQVEE